MVGQTELEIVGVIGADEWTAITALRGGLMLGETDGSVKGQEAATALDKASFLEGRCPWRIWRVRLVEVSLAEVAGEVKVGFRADGAGTFSSSDSSEAAGGRDGAAAV